MNFKETYNLYKKEIEDRLVTIIDENIHPTLRESMKYSLLGGGKRLRPVLYLSVLRGYGKTVTNNDFVVACAIECIHTYSLIHDDLPAMDDDDYRRGVLTNHKIYGEAVAILAGDALLNLAYELLAKTACVEQKYCSIMREIALCAGSLGMVGGQAIELSSSKSELTDITKLSHITDLKTGKLIECAMVSACLSAEKQEDLEIWKNIAFEFGRAFQLCDDLLDEEKESEISIAKLYGREKALQTLRDMVSDCKKMINELQFNGEFMSALCESILLRTTDGM